MECFLVQACSITRGGVNLQQPKVKNKGVKGEVECRVMQRTVAAVIGGGGTVLFDREGYQSVLYSSVQCS